MPSVETLRKPQRTERTDDGLRRLLDHWRDLAGGSPLPDVAALDLVSLPFPLADILVLSADDTSLEFRFDYTGSRWLLWFRRDVTGRLLSELAPDALGRFLMDALISAAGSVGPTRHGPPPAGVPGPALTILPFGRIGTPSRFLVALNGRIAPAAAAATTTTIGRA